MSSSLAVLGAAAIAQTLVFAVSGSIALLADLIHNYGDALTAVPLGVAFALRSDLAERRAGLFVVAAIFFSACVAAVLRITWRSWLTVRGHGHTHDGGRFGEGRGR